MDYRDTILILIVNFIVIYIVEQTYVKRAYTLPYLFLKTEWDINIDNEQSAS